MNWEILGAVSELVGALAVIVSLLYLAFQVRQHTRATRSSSFQATTDSLNQINMMIASDSDLVRVISSKPNSLQELSAEDRYRYSLVLLSLFRVRETVYHQQHEGTTAMQSWTREAITLKSNLKSKAAREWWKTVDYGFALSFHDSSTASSLISNSPKHSSEILEHTGNACARQYVDGTLLGACKKGVADGI